MRAITFNIKPVWQEINAVREKISIFLGGGDIFPDDIYSAVMAASELVENAIKYGDDTSGSVIEINAEHEKSEVIIEVKNRVKTDDGGNLEKLDRTVQWINSFQFPFEAYIEKLKYVSAKDVEIGESGLGLVRIAYEGHASVDFYLNEDQILCVSAVLHV